MMYNILWATFLLLTMTFNNSALSAECSLPFLTAKEYQAMQKLWINTYAVRSVTNQGETSVVPVGQPYFVALTHNTSVIVHDYSLNFPTPLLAISPADGVFSKFYASAMQDTLKETYVSGRHPMPAELAATEVAKLQEAKMSGDPRQIFYFTRLQSAPTLDKQVGAFVEIYDTAPIKGQAPRTSLEQRLGWTHPARKDPEHVVIELRRGYVGANAEVHELEQSKGLMRKVATYIDQYHLSQGRKVTLVSLTFDQARERALSGLYGFQRCREQPASEGSPWRVLEISGENFVQRFGSDRDKTQYHLNYRSAGRADPLFEPQNFSTMIKETTGMQKTRYQALREILSHDVYVADPAGGPPIMSLEELGTFEQHMDGLFIEQPSHFPLLWY